MVPGAGAPLPQSQVTIYQSRQQADPLLAQDQADILGDSLVDADAADLGLTPDSVTLNGSARNSDPLLTSRVLGQYLSAPSTSRASLHDRGTATTEASLTTTVATADAQAALAEASADLASPAQSQAPAPTRHASRAERRAATAMARAEAATARAMQALSSGYNSLLGGQVSETK